MPQLFASLTPPDFELSSAYPEADWLRRAATAGEWHAVLSYVANQPPGSDRCLVTAAIGTLDGVEEPLRRLVEEFPERATALALLACRETELARIARSAPGGRGAERERQARSQEHLRVAERLLITATALDPALDVAWAERLTTSRGLRLGRNETRRRYDRLSAVAPHHVTGQVRMLEQLLPEWGGGWAEAHAFAEECLAAAPEGALNGALVARAHVEQWHAAGTPGARSGYLRQPHVHRQLVEAADRSVAHPAFVRVPGWVAAEGCFALLFGLIGDRERAAERFRSLGGLADPYPWRLLGDPAAVHGKRRAAALGKG